MNAGWAPPADEHRQEGYRLAHNRLKDEGAASLRLARRLFTERLNQLDDPATRWEHRPAMWEIEGAIRAVDDLMADTERNVS